MTTKTWTHAVYPSSTASHGPSPASPASVPETTHTGSPIYPVSPVAPGEGSCPPAGTVTVTETIYASETATPAGPHTTETVTATLGNGQTTTIIVSYPAGPSDSAPSWSAPRGGNSGSLPPYPVPSESWSHSYSVPSGTVPALKPYPTAPRFVDYQEQLDVQHGVRERQHEPIKLGECYEDQLDHHGRDQSVYCIVTGLHQRSTDYQDQLGFQLERHIQRLPVICCIVPDSEQHLGCYAQFLRS
ncbi:hypothetical protein B0A55_11311 [Friedmanniomyces simplex]|uniref:Uncharacterized protein n=1 Tax=Friedmanniomyces simplex TaxID=329884 RepID=A0A4U0WG92_9PEZI|nr:hypothetical protein B0A55_11311 [Friedmanniomyces simplex]